MRARHCKRSSSSNRAPATQVIGLLGQTVSVAEAQVLIAHYRAADPARVLAAVTDHWNDVFGAIRIETPDRAMDLLLNRWAIYQTLACRMWARAGFYQASGAYGFRDQLQDSMALVYARPDLTRAHVLRAAARQFREGDVQHWWLPRSGVGVRTRISDDRAWLAYSTLHYVAVTGDIDVLDETIPFLEGPALPNGEPDAYFQPQVAEEAGSLFEHCARALDQSLAVGEHGLPLIGTGDWNDGMNRVGPDGKGESVWLGWLLHATLTRVRAVRRRASRHRSRAALARSRECDQSRARARRLGWELVPPGILRRWHAAWFCVERCVSNRFDCPIVGGDLRCCGQDPRHVSDDGRGSIARATRRPSGASIHAALRCVVVARSRLHQGLSAWHS